MYLSPSRYNKCDSSVAEVQRMLNSLRVKYHHEWDYLSEDGIYGRQTAIVVRKFQIYRGISSQMTSEGPVLGDTTIQYIRDSYNTLPMLSAPRATLQAKKMNTKQQFGFKEFADFFMSVLDNFDDFLKNEIAHVNSLRTNNPTALTQSYRSFATRLDPTMKKLKKHLNEYYSDSFLKKSFHSKNAKRNRKSLVSELKKLDIVSKIEKFLMSKGVKSDITIGKTNPINLHVKAGGIFLLWSFKDLILDMFRVDEWGTEEWWADLQNHFLELIDGFILGYAASVIAELVVAGIVALVAAVGVTIPVWLIIALVALVAVLITCMLDYLLDESDVSSFSGKLIEVGNEIISPVLARCKN